MNYSHEIKTEIEKLIPLWEGFNEAQQANMSLFNIVSKECVEFLNPFRTAFVAIHPTNEALALVKFFNSVKSRDEIPELAIYPIPLDQVIPFINQIHITLINRASKLTLGAINFGTRLDGNFLKKEGLTFKQLTQKPFSTLRCPATFFSKKKQVQVEAPKNAH